MQGRRDGRFLVAGHGVSATDRTLVDLHQAHEFGRVLASPELLPFEESSRVAIPLLEGGLPENGIFL
jgi:hypothetical protein